MNHVHMSELLDRELHQLAERAGSRKLSILETGTIRGDGEEYQSNDGWSTVTFAQHVRDHGGSLVSIDLDTTTAATVLQSAGLLEHVTLIQGHSIDVLAGMLDAGTPQLDLALLDSDNDRQLILHEYMLARRLVRPGGLILVDDVDPESVHVVKGHRLLPWLDRHSVPYRLDRRAGTGYATGVLVVEVQP